MEKIVRFFRKTFLIYIVFALLAIVLFLTKQKFLLLWLAHIFMVIHYMPIAYDLTGSINFFFCNHPLFKDKVKNKIICKKLTLKSFFKKLFCGYDDQGKIQWTVFVLQCVSLIYLCVFILLNFLFAITFLIGSADLTEWGKIWMFEIIIQACIFAICIISVYVKDIYLGINEKKNDKQSRGRTESIWKSDREMVRNVKIIKQRGELTDILKKYGLCVDKNGEYFINHSDITQIEEVLSKKYPKLYSDFSKYEEKKQLFNVYTKKDKRLLIQMYIK